MLATLISRGIGKYPKNLIKKITNYKHTLILRHSRAKIHNFMLFTGNGVQCFSSACRWFLTHSGKVGTSHPNILGVLFWDMAEEKDKL